jgi:hypothetical protein
MAGLKLDAAGVIKLKTLDEALLLLQRLNGLVEQYGLAIKRGQPSTVYVMNIRRTFPTLAENLKAQFGLISDLVTSVNLATSRGASEQMKLRGMREGVAQIKQAIEIAATQTKAKHAVHDEKDEPTGEDGGAQ